MTKFSTNRISNSSVLLKPLEVADYSEDYLSWLNDESINRYLETRWEEQTEEKIKTFIKSIEADNNSVLYGIFSDNIHIGNIKLGPINWRHSHADVSYFIGSKKYWGKGIATEAVSLVTNFAFNELELHKCNAGVYSGNIGSAKVLEKVGYQLEGRLKDELFGPEGWEDHLLYGYLNKSM